MISVNIPREILSLWNLNYVEGNRYIQQALCVDYTVDYTVSNTVQTKKKEDFLFSLLAPNAHSYNLMRKSNLFGLKEIPAGKEDAGNDTSWHLEVHV